MKKKILALALVFCLALALGIGGTLAYLTSTDTVTNTFTVGNVAITLDEAKVGADGKKLTGEGAGRTQTTTSDSGTPVYGGNSYKLMPNHEYEKDPTVTVKKGSEDSYVRMLVTVKFDKELNEEWIGVKLSDVNDPIITGYSTQNWKRNGEPKTETKTKSDGSEYTVITYEFRYVGGENGGVVNGGSDESGNKLPALFTGIKVPSTWTNDDLEAIGSFTIDIVAQAIQADGFNTADAAWVAFAEQQ